jgi:photoactive yellow protein
MEHISFEGVNLAELLPRIPDSIKDGLPFGLVKLDLTGTILEYNMAEGDLTGVDPKWAIGKNFFDDVALCTKTQAFYGRFLEGVKKGFLNAVFDYTFDHREIATQVKVHMVTIPNHLGQKNVMILVKRSNKPLVMDAIGEPAPAALAQVPRPAEPASAAQPSAAPSIQDIVSAVMAAMNQGTNIAGQSAPAQEAQAAAAPAAPAPAPKSGSRHEDILKF